jgi:hypothetical protein
MANPASLQHKGRAKGSKNKRSTKLQKAIASQLGALPRGYVEPLVKLVEEYNKPEPVLDGFQTAK